MKCVCYSSESRLFLGPRPGCIRWGMSPYIWIYTALWNLSNYWSVRQSNIPRRTDIVTYWMSVVSTLKGLQTYKYFLFSVLTRRRNNLCPCWISSGLLSVKADVLQAVEAKTSNLCTQKYRAKSKWYNSPRCFARMMNTCFYDCVWLPASVRVHIHCICVYAALVHFFFLLWGGNYSDERPLYSAGVPRSAVSVKSMERLFITGGKDV